MGKVNDLLSNNDVLIVFHTCYLLPKCNIAYYWKKFNKSDAFAFSCGSCENNFRWIQTTGPIIKNPRKSKSLITY